MCIRQASKCSNNCFKRFCWTVPYLTSSIMYHISLHPRDSAGFQDQSKKMKNEHFLICSIQYLTLYSVNMTYNLKKSIIQWESVCICICLRPRRGSFSAECVVLYNSYSNDFKSCMLFSYVLHYFVMTSSKTGFNL